jgi:outer membrane protein
MKPFGRLSVIFKQEVAPHRHYPLLTSKFIMTQRLLAVIILLSTLNFSTLAQEGTQVRTLTLDECISIGLEKNLDVNRSKLNIERSKASRLDAYGNFLPSLNGSGRWIRADKSQRYNVNEREIISRDNYSISASSNLTLFDGLANFRTVDKSLLDLEASEMDYGRRKETYVYTVNDSYLNVLRIVQLVRVNEANLERARKQLERIKEQNAVGSVPLADVYRQEVEVGRYELQYFQAVNDHDNAKAELLNLIGENPGQNIDLDENSVQTRLSLGEIDSFNSALDDYEVLVQKAVKQRLDYRSSELGLESARKTVSIAWAGYSPLISAFAQYNWTNIEFKDFFNDGSFSYGLNLSVPIFNNFRTQTSIQYAQINERESYEFHKELERSVAVNIRKALNTLQYSSQNVRIAQQTLRSAQEDQRIASERYNLGAGILLDLTTANANLTSAESDVVNSRFNYVRARKLLEYHLGTTL